MQVEETSLPGVFILSPKVFGDARGFFMESFNQKAFEEAYLHEYGRLLSNINIRVMNVRVSVIGHRAKFDLSLLAPSKSSSLNGAEIGKRSVYSDGNWLDVKIFDRLSLPIGARINGPAILEQPDTTIFLEGNMVGSVDDYGNFLIRVEN